MALEATPHADAVEYPDSDGQPMAENTLQFEWIVTLKENLDALLPDFVAGDLLWYPVKGDPKTRMAPDVLVALGRPKGHRGSFKQWLEGGPPEVVFEVWSPGNRPEDRAEKLRIYERFGVLEYYAYDPDFNRLEAWIRREGRLSAVVADGWESPLLGIRFRVGVELEVYGRNGNRFLSFGERAAAQLEAEARAWRETQKRMRATRALEQAEVRVEAELQRAVEASQRAEEASQRAEEASQRAEEASQRAEVEAQARMEAEARLAEALAKLKALGLA